MKFLQSDPHNCGNWIYNNSGMDCRTVGKDREWVEKHNRASKRYDITTKGLTCV